MRETLRITRPGLAIMAAAATMVAATAALAGTPAAARAGTASPPGPLAVTQSLPTRPTAAGAGHVVPLWRLPRNAQPGRYPGQHMAPGSIGEPGGYDPSELRAYLGLTGTGAGQTVTVTEAYDVSQSVPAALATYDSWYGLPPACSATVTTGCFHLTFAAPQGTCQTNVSPSFCFLHELSWTLEADLDVELIHALAPQASIVVAEGYDDSVSSMVNAIDYAQTLHPAVVSNSWAADEFSAEQTLDGHCPATGAPCVFSSGDSGNYATCLAEGGAPGCGGYPAASPGVLAVGGTRLNLAASGKVLSETAWSGSGGGTSAYEPFPAYQQKADPYPTGRGIPDVSFDADPASGVAIYWDAVGTFNGRLIQRNQEWVEVGGTSAGAPAWAAILASAAQARAAAGRPPLTIAAVHAAVYAKSRKKPVADITTGINGTCGAQCSARPGYDLVTGEGSPRAGIVSYLASR